MKNTFNALYRYLFVMSFLTLVMSCTKKNVDPDGSSLTGNVYAEAEVDQPPTPQGGKTGLTDYLVKNLRYPLEAQRANLQ